MLCHLVCEYEEIIISGLTKTGELLTNHHKAIHMLSSKNKMNKTPKSSYNSRLVLLHSESSEVTLHEEQTKI